jgi:molecular chaperone DnaJ
MKLRVRFDQAAHGVRTTFSYVAPTRCSACSGSGVSGQSACPGCRGAGLVQEKRNLSVNIPSGAESGDTVRLRAKGADGQGGAEPGDLVLEIQVEPHPTLTREGRDLVTRLVIGPLDAMLGVETTVTGLDGPVTVKVPPAHPAGQRLRVAGKGVTRKDQTGDLLVDLAIDASLQPLRSDSSRDLARQLRASLG